MKKLLRNNGLSLVLFGLFLLALLFQSVAGKDKYNEDQDEHGKPPVSYLEYLKTDDFIEATAENWESEFLQMFAFVILTRFLYQKGSSESQDPESREEEEETPWEKQPWPVRRGGWVLKLYEHSLSLTFLLMFLVSVLMHAVGGSGQYNQEQMDHGQGKHVSVLGYLLTSSFWFESMQNWQSEFLSLFAMVVCTIWLREKGSPESKAVDAPHDRTGE